MQFEQVVGGKILRSRMCKSYTLCAVIVDLSEGSLKLRMKQNPEKIEEKAVFFN